MSVDRANLHFTLRRLHGLSGIVPVGAFLLEHFFTNAHVTVSAAKFEEAARGIQSLPFLWVMEIFFIALPLTFHALYGFYIWYQGRENKYQYPYFRNWLYTLQRWTGLILFFYIGYHVYHTRINWLLHDVYPGARYMHEYLGSGLNPPIYYLAVAVASFHFANGLWNVACKWGVAITPQGQRLVGYACGALGAALLLTGVAIVETFIGLDESELGAADAISAQQHEPPPAFLAQQGAEGEASGAGE